MNAPVKKTDRKPLPPGPGRPKGTPNKTTALLKEALIIAATKAGGREGLVGYLQKRADDTPGPFLALLGKVLPLQVSGDPDNPLRTHQRIEITIVDPPARR